MVLLLKFDLLIVSFYWLAELKNLRTSESVSVLLSIAASSEHVPWVITSYVHFSLAELPLIILIFTSVCYFFYTQC